MSAEEQLLSSSGTVRQQTYYDGPTYSDDGIVMKQRFFTYETDGGLVSGINIDVSFTVEGPPNEVWPTYCDFNLWQNAHGYSYPGVIGDLYGDPVGDLGSATFKITITPPGEDAYEWPDEYRLVKVIPERAIVLHQIVPADDRNGGVSPGFHILLLQEDANGNSVATITMEHATRLKAGSEGDPTQTWRDLAPEYERFWVHDFIKELRRLAQAGS